MDLRLKVKARTLHTLSKLELVSVVDALFCVRLQALVVHKGAALSILVPREKRLDIQEMDK